MSHESYDLAHSPFRHNSFIFVKMFSSIDAASLGGVFWRREFIVRAHTAAQIFYFLLWLTVLCLSSSAWELVVQLICIFVHPSGAILFSFLWTAHKTSLSDWLVLRGLWIRRTHWLDLCWGGKQTFLRIRFSLMRSMGEQRSKENTQWVVWVELLSVKSLDAQVLELYFFPVQSKEHTRTSWQGSLLILCLVSPPFSLSLSVGADYDVHSLLSSWFWLVCNQRRAPVSYRPCCCSPDYIRVHYCISSLFGGVWLL